MIRLAALLLIALATRLAHAEAPLLKVMSLNIRFDEAMGEPSSNLNAWITTPAQHHGDLAPHRRDLAVKVIVDYQPDLLCVQEALQSQVEDIKNALPEHACYFIGRDDGLTRGESCSIFFRKSRFRRIDAGTFWLNEQFDKPGSRFPETCCARIASWVVLQDMDADKREYFVLNTHWDHQVQAARLFSAKIIRQRMKELAGQRPILVAGDLNVSQENAAYKKLIGKELTGKTQAGDWQLIDSFREIRPQPKTSDRTLSTKVRHRVEEGTFNGFKGRSSSGHRIDYILHNGKFQTQDVGIIRTHVGDRYPSDHFPVTATLLPLLD